MLTKKKLGEFFLRKEDRKQKPIDQQIDESYFNCNLTYQPNTLSLIKINAKIIKGDLAGQSLPLNCKWYAKTKFDFKEIQSVKASYYQPCLDDVGATICVQIEPHLEGKVYNGVTIMKQIGPLQLPAKLQNESQQLLKQQKIMFRTKVEAIFSQDPRFEFIQQPLESQIIIQSSYIYFIRLSNNQEVCFYQITSNFPQIQFIKKSFNSILISFNMNESMRLSFQDNYKRDLFVLIIRNIMVDVNYYRNKQIKSKQQNQYKSNTQKQQNKDQIGNTLLILKIDQLNKQNKQLKKQYQQLLQNYHYQRQAKLKSIQQTKITKEQKEKYRIQAQNYKESDLKLKKQSSQNRFLLNENSLLKKDKKVLQQENVFFKNKLQYLSKYLSQKRQQKNITPIAYSLEKEGSQKIQQLVNKIDKITQENSIIQEKYQKEIQKLQNQNYKLNKKIDSLLSEKVILSPQKQKHYDENQQINSHKKQIEALKLQIKNLQMLLKYKIGQKGNQNINFQQIINKFTQIITQKQQQLQIQKKVNKQLISKLKLTKDKQ